MKKTAMLNEIYVQTRVKRLEIGCAQMLQRVAKDPKMLEAFLLVMQNPFVQTLKTNYASLQLNITELSDRYGFKHPAIQHKRRLRRKRSSTPCKAL